MAIHLYIAQSEFLIRVLLRLYCGSERTHTFKIQEV